MFYLMKLQNCSHRRHDGKHISSTYAITYTGQHKSIHRAQLYFAVHYIFIYWKFLQVGCQFTSCLACRNKHSNSFHVLFFIHHCAKVLSHLYFLFILLPRSQIMLSGLSESLQIDCFLHSLLVQSFLCPFSEECFLSLFWFNVFSSDL